VLHKLENQLIYFIDDDMRLNRQTILSMYNAAASLGRNAYFGGPLLVDYEGLPPPEWLKQYLPNSAKGLQLDIQRVEECKPGLFFGANWAAYAEDLKRVGGFNESMGPTQIAIGEDSMAQENLYKIGLRPYYVPDAIVWHFVPQSNCSQAFALKRRFKTGVYWTIKSNETTCSITKRLLKAFFIMVVNFIRMIYYLFMDDIRGIREVRFKLARQFGALFGIVFLIKNNISRCLKALFATMLYNDTE
jgi:GT2 family glycosyltransferase